MGRLLRKQFEKVSILSLVRIIVKVFVSLFELSQW